MESLKEKIPGLEKELVNELFKKDWVVYAKRPFGNPMSVIEYLGRYTHKIAISNHRITAVANGKVTFSYKDYRQGAKKHVMTLAAMEFIRRFSMHILPKCLVRIRHYGILSSTGKKAAIPVIREQLPQRIIMKNKRRQLNIFNPKMCPCCKTETMVMIECIAGRGPPVWSGKIKYEK